MLSSCNLTPFIYLFCGRAGGKTGKHVFEAQTGCSIDAHLLVLEAPHTTLLFARRPPPLRRCQCLPSRNTTTRRRRETSATFYWAPFRTSTVKASCECLFRRQRKATRERSLVRCVGCFSTFGSARRQGVSELFRARVIHLTAVFASRRSLTPLSSSLPYMNPRPLPIQAP